MLTVLDQPTQIGVVAKSAADSQFPQYNTRLSAVETAVTSIQSQSFQKYGAVDDGVVDCVAAYNLAQTDLPRGSVLKLPRVTNAIYDFSQGLFFGALWLDPDPGVALSLPNVTTYDANLLGNLMLNIRANAPTGPYQHYITKNFRKAGADKDQWLDDPDVDRSETVALNVATDVKYRKVFWPTGDGFVADTPTVENDQQLGWPVTQDGFFRCGMVPARPGDELSCAFPSPDSWTRVIMIRCTQGYMGLYCNQAGDTAYFYKPVGTTGAANNGITWLQKSLLQFYQIPFGKVSIRVIDQKTAVILVGDMIVTSLISAYGEILEIGFGCNGAMSTTVTAHVSGWLLRRKGVFGGTAGFGIILLGDSLTDPYPYGQWPYYLKEAVDGSLGMRCTSLDNRAVSGETSAQQLERLQPTAWASNTAYTVGQRRGHDTTHVYEVVTAGTSGGGGPTGTGTSIADGTNGLTWKYIGEFGLGTNNKIAIVCLGNNDIQGRVSVGDVGVAGSYVDNINQICNIFTNAYIPVIIVTPSMFYDITDTPNRTGQATGNYGGGAAYHLSLMRFAAKRGIRVVSFPEIDGSLDPNLLLGDQVQVDPWLRDNAHPTVMASRVRALKVAKAVAAVMVPRSDKRVTARTLGITLSNSWALDTNTPPKYTRSSDGFVALHGILDAGTLPASGGSVLVATLPAFMSPQAPMTVPVMTSNASIAEMLIGTDGTMTLYSWPTGATWFSLDTIRFQT